MGQFRIASFFASFLDAMPVFPGIHLCLTLMHWSRPEWANTFGCRGLTASLFYTSFDTARVSGPKSFQHRARSCIRCRPSHTV